MLPLAKFSANKGKEAENSPLGETLEGTEKGNKAKSGGHYLLRPAKRCILPVTKEGNGRRGMLTSLGLEEPNTPQPTSIWATDSIHGALSHCGQGMLPYTLSHGVINTIINWCCFIPI